MLCAAIAVVLSAREEPVLAEGLAVTGVTAGGRTPAPVDRIVAEVVAGSFAPPTEGQTVPGTESAWRKVKAGEDGVVPLQGSGYVWWQVPSPTARIAILQAEGHGTVYVNGVPRGGDVYSTGYVQTPVAVKPGDNGFLFAVGRGRLKARLTEPPAPQFISDRDVTLPDILEGQDGGYEGAVVVVNATEQSMRFSIRATVDGRHWDSDPFFVPPLGIRKSPFGFESSGGSPLTLQLMDWNDKIVHERTFQLTVKQPTERHNRTFRSQIDRSVQYYGVQPAPDTLPGKALVLSLHGASVEASGQAGAYGQKSWAHIVCPTNRRPFGFDWEDWGRIDAYEVLAHAEAALQTDHLRRTLTGHSMGGHGTWYVGSMSPTDWAAIAPAAGWIDFWTYAGAEAYPGGDPVTKMMSRAANQSRTRLWGRNLAHTGVYVLHGDADETVPVREARTMREFLAAFHRDVDWFEQPGGGHWYDTTPDAGADCVDFPPLFEFLARRRRLADDERRRVDFTTVNPGVSAEAGFVRIVRQVRPLEPSNVTVERSLELRTVTGTTSNCAIVRFEVPQSTEAWKVTLDGQDASASPINGALWLRRSGESWLATDPEPSAALGPFKRAFNERFVLVYGTGGSAWEREWALSKARLDADNWWIRGNGTADVLSDEQFVASEEYGDRNVILYGSAPCNRAWANLLDGSPFSLTGAQSRVGGESFDGQYGLLAAWPRSGRRDRLVGVIAANGPEAARTLDRLPYFLAGVHYPDWTLVTPELPSKGLGGIAACGFFGPDWRVAGSETARR